MQRRTHCLTLQFESLESKLLLSTVSALHTRVVNPKLSQIAYLETKMNTGESGQGGGFIEPGGAPEQAAVSFTPPDMKFTPPDMKGLSPIGALIERISREMAKIPGVHGVSEGRTPIGDPAVRIDVEDDSVRARLPKEIEGYSVEVVVVPGGFEILPVR